MTISSDYQTNWDYAYPCSEITCETTLRINTTEYEDAHIISSLLKITESVCTDLNKTISSTGSLQEIDFFDEADIFKLGFVWEYIVQKNIPLQDIISEISNRRNEILNQKLEWREYLNTQEIGPLEKIYRENEQTLKLIRIVEGCGSTYCVVNNKKEPILIIKPVDEDILCLNNSKHYGNPFNNGSYSLKRYVPLYTSHQAHLLCYLLSKELGIEGITPRCEIAIISSDKFHDLSSTISSENLQLLEQIGSKDLEKLCSIQEYIPHTKDFLTLMCEYLKKGNSLGILDVLDNDNIEDLNLLLWASYDNDAHPGNFLVTEIVDPHTQKVTIKLIKVDNAMSFPEHNIGFDNFLFTFDVKRDSISDRLRKKISSFKEENIANLMKDLKFSKSSIESFIERISILKELSRRESISLFEINLRFTLLGRSNGKDLALSDYSIPKLEAILSSDHLLDTTSRISL